MTYYTWPVIQQELALTNLRVLVYSLCIILQIELRLPFCIGSLHCPRVQIMVVIINNTAIPVTTKLEVRTIEAPPAVP